MYQKIYNKIKEYSTIIIHRHTRPDGDALGSQIGLKEAILATFPNKEVLVVGDSTKRYEWIGLMDNVNDKKYQNALIFVVDCGSEDLISDKRYLMGAYIIKIDHHIPQGEYGDLIVVKTSFESCAGIIADLLLNTPMIINNAAATALFTGIITDSGRFRYSSTTAKTYQIVSSLMDYNINTEQIYKNIYTEKLETIKLRAHLISKFIVLENGLAYLINTKDEVKNYMEQYNVNVFDISRGMVNIMSGIDTIDIWVNFTEDLDGNIFVEFRSNKIGVNSIASKYGGGGHLLASGCSVKDYDTVNKIINDLKELVREQNV